MRRRQVTTALCLFFTAVVVTPVFAQIAVDRQRVVYHINGDDRSHQVTALLNIQNHLDAVGPDHIDLQVVLHGDGLSLLLLPAPLDHVTGFAGANANEQMQARLDSLRHQGVLFKICANTLRSRGVDYHRDLYLVDDADIVASGVAELARLQSLGYVYIKP